MTFLEALKTGRPMRRKSGGDYQYPWLILGNEAHYPNAPCWRRVATGERDGLAMYDYLADNWEVMP